MCVQAEPSGRFACTGRLVIPGGDELAVVGCEHLPMGQGGQAFDNVEASEAPHRILDRDDSAIFRWVAYLEGVQNLLQHVVVLYGSRRVG